MSFAKYICYGILRSEACNLVDDCLLLEENTSFEVELCFFKTKAPIYQNAWCQHTEDHNKNFPMMRETQILKYFSIHA